MEALVVGILESRPCVLEVVVPREERLIIIRPEVVPVFDRELGLRRIDDLLHARHDAVGEDVRVDPWISTRGRLAASDRVQEEQAVVFHAAGGGLHVRAIVLVAHVLEHADRDYLVECPEFLCCISVVHQMDLDRKPFA